MREIFLLLMLYVLVTVTHSQPIELRKTLPHSRDYYEGYIKALTDNFEQLFGTERTTRSTTDDEEEDEPPTSHNEDEAKIASKRSEDPSKVNDTLKNETDTSKAASAQNSTDDSSKVKEIEDNAAASSNSTENSKAYEDSTAKSDEKAEKNTNTTENSLGGEQPVITYLLFLLNDVHLIINLIKI